MNSAQERLDCRRIDFYHFVRNAAVSFPMHTLGSFLGRRFYKRKNLTSFVIEPVGQELDPIFFLPVSMARGALPRQFQKT